MKIVNVMQCTELGGMEQASLRLMLGLMERGHRCEVISLNPVGGLGPLLERHGIPARGLANRGRGGWRSFSDIRRALRKVEADAVIMTGHHLVTMLALGKLARGRRLLAIHFHHGGVKPDWQWRLIYRLALSRFQAITFPSEFVRREAEQLYPPVASVSHLIRNPLTLPGPATGEDRRRARRALGLPEDRPIVGNAGWLIRRKRFDVFLEVAAQVVKKVPDALFVIAGDGEERAALETLAGRLEIADRVRWLGWQQDLSPFYLSLDVMLFNSDWDAMGLAPLEAMSYGVPLVASVVQGGLKEIITEDRYGFLAATHDLGALADRVVFLLGHPEAARTVAQAGRERVAELSSLKSLTCRVEALLAGNARLVPNGEL